MISPAAPGVGPETRAVAAGDPEPDNHRETSVNRRVKRAANDVLGWFHTLLNFPVMGSLPDELRWVFPSLEIKNVTVASRQSRQLNDLATAIVLAVGGTPPTVSMPAHVNSEGVPPALLEGPPVGGLVPWLAARIREIEGSIGQLPSIAVFVPSEEEVKPLAKDLNDALVDHNIQVTPCSEGQVIGQEQNVRVFDAQHIKGLEFEAVFFVGVDRLAEAQPDLFDKYLYVGTTRAATYLGLTCEKQLPAAIAGLRSMFAPDWASA